MALKFTNNASATLAASIISSSTSITVTTGQGALFPAIGSGDYFYATLFDSSNNIEIIKVTARSGDTMTAIRGQDGTTARAYAAADKLELRVVAAALNDFVVENGDNTLTGNNTFSGNIASSGTNTHTGTNNFTGPVAFTAIPTFNGGSLPVANGGTGGTTSTGSGAVVLATSPTLVTATLTTPTLTTPTISTYGNIKALFETATITASTPPSVTNFDVVTQAVQYYTTNTASNFTLNIRGDGSTSLNSILSTGQVVTIALLVVNGTTAYYPNAFTIDGASVTPKWQAGYTPTSGDASSINVYTFTVVKTASATFTVLASQTKYA